MNDLSRLIYISDIDVEKLDSDMVSGILHSARKNNPDWGITGMLVSDYHHFIQVLEGKPGSVEALFRRIKEDLRHRHVRLLENVPVTARLFGEWSMGFSKLGAIEASGEYDAANITAKHALNLLVEQAKRSGAQTF